MPHTYTSQLSSRYCAGWYFPVAVIFRTHEVVDGEVNNCYQKKTRPQLYEGSEGKGAPQIGLRLPPEEIAAIDRWIDRQKETLSRPVAVRRLVAMGLEAAKKGGKGR